MNRFARIKKNMIIIMEDYIHSVADLFANPALASSK